MTLFFLIRFFNLFIFQPQASVNQLANAVLTARHLAQAMATINMQKHMQQQMQQHQMSNTPVSSDSAFQVPAKKKPKLTEAPHQSAGETTNPAAADLTPNPLNSSICSISSPSSSSAYSSSSFSFNDYTGSNPSDSYNHNHHHLDHLTKHATTTTSTTTTTMDNNGNQQGCSSATSNSSSASNSFNDSNEFFDGHGDSERSSPFFSALNECRQQLGTPSIRRSSK